MVKDGNLPAAIVKNFLFNEVVFSSDASCRAISVVDKPLLLWKNSYEI